MDFSDRFSLLQGFQPRNRFPFTYFRVKSAFLGTLSVTGVIYGVAASIFVALNAIYTQRTLPSVGDSIAQLTL